MSKEEKRAPEVRFEGFHDDWKQRKLGDHAIIKGRLGWKNLKQEEYLPTGPNMIAGRHISDGMIDWKKVNHIPEWRYEESPEIMLENGDIIFTKDGSLGNPALVTYLPDKSTINSTMMLVRTDDTIDSGFFYQILQSKQFQKLIYLKVSGSSVPHLFQADMNKFYFFAPTVYEQKMLNALLSKIEVSIALHQEKLSRLQSLKKVVLQSLFPKNKQLKPEVRFNNFKEKWIQRKLGEILKSHTSKPYLADPAEKGAYKVIQQGDEPVAGYADNKPFEDYKGVTLFGDHTVSLYKPVAPFLLATDGVKILSAEGFCGEFLYTLLERYKPMSQGYKRHFKILKNQDILFPKSKKEQSRIAGFFTSLEETIILNQTKLETLQTLKKAFLQKMFI